MGALEYAFEQLGLVGEELFDGAVVLLLAGLQCLGGPVGCGALPVESGTEAGQDLGLSDVAVAAAGYEVVDSVRAYGTGFHVRLA